MEPENHPFAKENHLASLHYGVLQLLPSDPFGVLSDLDLGPIKGSRLEKTG